MSTAVHTLNFSVVRVELTRIEALRQAFLDETEIQFVHNKCHHYGWADTYLFLYEDKPTGYGSVWGKDHRDDRDCIFEFYLLPMFRRWAGTIFQMFREAAKTPYVECQTNDFVLAALFFENAYNICTQAILFQDHEATTWQAPEVTFYREELEINNTDDMGGYVLQHHGHIIARGGMMLNYNAPYADIYMDVLEAYRRQGFGSFLVQELKKIARNAGHIPAARCNVRNQASKYTLLKAGFRVSGYLLQGQVRP